jgi:uncharacterized coiled-coil protein SlyX
VPKPIVHNLKGVAAHEEDSPTAMASCRCTLVSQHVQRIEAFETHSDTGHYEHECEPTPIVHDFESRIYDLETKLSSAQEIIFQLLGGLFNHETQKQIVDNHMKFLYTGRGLTDEEVEESIWPTTRQGDANEERIQQLEENLDILVKRLKKGKPLHRFYRKFQKKVNR